ncbi:MAG: PEP/pyruvate-binding domain-containing protein, partial [Planctomycetota bacterium]
NFFMVTCPYLYELDTITYFALIRNRHSYKTIARIRETTQLLLDLYNISDTFYVHPLKVWKRYTPTMFLPHQKQDDKYVPLTASFDTTKLISYMSQKGLEPAQRVLDNWDRLFLKAELLSQERNAPDEEKKQTVEHLCNIMIGKETRILSLAMNLFLLEDLLNIKKRLIGTGFVGGKAVGMLLANKIISLDKDLKHQLEPHDSFYVGSDVFYTYLVENGCWKLRLEQKTKEGYFKVAPELQEQLLNGRFPDQVREQFQEMLEYFGQSPIIVRSSSLLEDAFGNAFAGKYESVFCVNQGSPEERYARFEEAVRTVYASTMSEDALTYRLQRGLDKSDEQMALLIQRVSGSYRKSYFFPDLAGVGISHNTFVWKPDLDPKAGMLRLVFGLGTRAVNRVEDDYPRVISLDEPLLRPVAGMDDVRKYSQQQVDLLDTEKNLLRTIPFREVLSKKLDINLDLIAIEDVELAKRARKAGQKDQKYLLLTFEKLLSKTPFAQTMQKILKTLEAFYEYPVDVEFTVNFTDTDKPFVNLLQCRPLQTKGQETQVQFPTKIEPQKILFQCQGYSMGGSISQRIKELIYVEPSAYIELPLQQKYDVARLIGKLNKQITDREKQPVILMGPGRWGTTTPSLGIPVHFAEINNVSVLVEIAYEGGNLMPELSFGTHFFQDLVEGDIFYTALFPKKENVAFNKNLLLDMPNQLTELVPEGGKYTNVVKACRIESENLQIISNVVSNKLVCFFE